jgi:hypothetical protein
MQEQQQQQIVKSPTYRVVTIGLFNFFVGIEKAKLPLIMAKRIKDYINADDVVLGVADRNKKYDLLVVGPYHKPSIAKAKTFNARTQLMFACEEPKRLCITEQLITQNCDFAIGYVTDKGATSVRMPNWYFYWDFLDNEMIQEPEKTMEGRKKWACFIARMDHGNTRQRLVKTLQVVIKTDCPGKVANNMPSVEQVTGIRGDGNRAKLTFIKGYVFNLCPENDSIPGYSTEKIMQAVMAGCIPIYWGHSHVEPNILNQNRLIWCQSNTAIGPACVTKLQDLLRNEQKLNDFFQQPVFIEGAQKQIEIVKKRFDDCVRLIAARITS